MSKRQTTLVKIQNRKPYPTKAQFVVSCVKMGSVEQAEKLQNKGIANSFQRIDRITKEAYRGDYQ